MRRSKQPTHVLAFVEDEARAGTVKTLLGGVQGITTELAYTTSHIQRYSAAAPVDVILLDLTAYEQADATALIESLLAPGLPTQHIPLVGLFADGSEPETRLAAVEAGLSEVCIEPVDEIHLLTRLVLLARVKQAEDQIRQLAITDPVTGLFDGRYFFLRLGEELSRARRYARPLCCLLCAFDDASTAAQLDNPELHQRFIMQLAVILQAEKRDIDVLARTGTDELALLLYNTDIPGAVVLVERVRKYLAELEPDESGHLATISCGLAATKSNEEPNMHPEEFRQRAALALSQALAQGGGCTVVYSAELSRQMLEA